MLHSLLRRRRPSGTRARRRIAVTAAGLGLAVVAALLPAGTAFAWEGVFVNHGWTSGTGIHVRPLNTTTVVEFIQPQEQVMDFCYVIGQTLNGTGAWDLVFDPESAAKGGWTNEWYLQDKSQSLHCDSQIAKNFYGVNRAGRSGSGIHTCASNTCPAVAFLPGNSDSLELCYTTGQTLGNTNRWSLIYYYQNGQRTVGWTNQDWLYDAGTTWPC